MPKKKLSSDDSLALVLSGLKGEVPVSDLCRKYSVFTATYYKLRDQFIAGGVQGLQNNGKTNQVKSLELRIKDLEQALGRKTLEDCDVALLYSAYATPEYNAHIERFFRTLKEEELYYNLYETYSEAITSIEAYIDFL
ncbi:MAG: transposase [Syntrophomonadaceae bacterium]|jgi:transposase-like protein|nr:transposase [Syntrophomonadaceae bacterium]